VAGDLPEEGGDLVLPPQDADAPIADSGRSGSLAGRLAGVLAAERDRLTLWLPVAMGAGIAGYFALPAEPAAWIGPALVAVLTLALIAGRHRPPLLAGFAFALAIAIGLAAAQVRTASVAAPMLDRRVGPSMVEGTVVDAEIRIFGPRVVLASPWVEDLSGPDTPRHVRINISRAAAGSIALGDRVRVLAILLPPRGPVIPGGRDFRRRAFFEELGAVGFTLGDPDILSRGAASAAALGLGQLRAEVVARIRAVLEGDAAAMAVALMTGERGLIREPIYESIQAAGLAHLLAISGLHIGLVAGLVFFGTRAGLALVTPLALAWPIKKTAAVAAWLSALGYMLLVGSPVPTERAFLMTSLVLLAVLVDRTAISMRLVAWAAMVILLMSPEALLGPSFQMSFAAVVALVAAYEGLSDRWSEWRWQSGWPTRFALYLLGVALTTLVAGTATAPFAMAHFQRLATYGSLSNLLAVPLTAFWIMPFGLLAFLLMPFGLEAVGLVPMGWGIDLLLAVSETAGGWPGAAIPVPAMPGWAMAAVSLGGLWLCLWRHPWRYAGVIGIAAGFASPGFADRPDILIADNGRVQAVRAAGGGLLMSTDRREAFTRDIWLSHDGSTEAAGIWPDLGPGPDGSLSCDPLGCLYRHEGWTVALVRHGRALAEDCRLADIVVTTEAVPRGCPAAVIVDRFDLWRDGAHAIYLDGPDIRIRAAGRETGDRPWR
jgi:competence protein ComEC